jgi:hypothetical protein
MRFAVPAGENGHRGITPRGGGHSVELDAHIRARLMHLQKFTWCHRPGGPW